MRPCETEFIGRLFSDFCDECHHVLMVHTEDRVCSVCDAVAHIQLSEAARG